MNGYNDLSISEKEAAGVRVAVHNDIVSLNDKVDAAKAKCCYMIKHIIRASKSIIINTMMQCLAACYIVASMSTV